VVAAQAGGGREHVSKLYRHCAPPTVWPDAAPVLGLGMAVGAAAAGHKAVQRVAVLVRAVGMADQAILARKVAPSHAVVGAASVVCHGKTRVVRMDVAGDADAAGRGADPVVVGVYAQRGRKDDRPARSGYVAWLYQDVFSDAVQVAETAVGVVALDAVQAKVIFYASRKITIRVRGDDGGRRRAGAIVAGVAKRVVLGREIKDRSARAGVYAVTGGANVAHVSIVAVRAALGQGGQRQTQAQECGGYYKGGDDSDAPFHNWVSSR